MDLYVSVWGHLLCHLTRRSQQLLFPPRLQHSQLPGTNHASQAQILQSPKRRQCLMLNWFSHEVIPSNHWSLLPALYEPIVA